jgi:DnaA family protein
MAGVTMANPEQLFLGLSLSDDATFANFFIQPQSSNALAVANLTEFLHQKNENFIYLWGGSGSGVTHLLQAVCHQAQEHQINFQYLPLRELVGYSAEEICGGLDELQLVCLDGFEAVAGRPDWESAIFNLFNRLREKQHKFIIAANAPARELRLQLPDLISRLQWGLTLHLQTMTDEEKKSALQMRAKVRGLDLNDEVAQFLIQRLSRDTNELFWQLQRLDNASLQEQRKLTIPFVKKILGLG